MTTALLVVPPFVKATSGPPLGPPMLRGAALAAGHDVEVVDLAIEEVRRRVSAADLCIATGLAGDHDKNRAALGRAQEEFFAPVASAVARPILSVTTCALTWPEVERAVAALTTSGIGAKIEARLRCVTAPPGVVGLSVMFADQVLAALVVTEAARRLWPEVPVVWGGTHVSALAPEIAADARYGRSIEGFVAGYAEETFVALLDAIEHGLPWPDAVFRAGSRRCARARDRAAVVPAFTGLSAYGAPRLTLPAQLSRGCSYGACTFCTYPAIEGTYRVAPDLGHVPAVVRMAVAAGAVVSLKDAYLTTDSLSALARAIDGRVLWSGCTRVDSRLAARMKLIAASGCETLELGVESVLAPTQALIRKKQPHRTLISIVEEGARCGVRLVLNYMTGFPGEDLSAAREALDVVRALASDHGHVVEHHEFELERRAPLAKVVNPTASWPWASIVEWRAGHAASAAA